MVSASKCTCGKIVAPYRDFCPKCGGKTTKIDIGNKGILLTYTILYTTPNSFKSPLYIALVELEHGVKLICECKNPDDLVIGREVELKKEGKKYYF